MSIKKTERKQAGSINAQEMVIDTLSLTIHYPKRETDYIECRKLNSPIREKMVSSLNNHINLELYKPKALSQEMFCAMAGKILKSYGFDSVKITSCGTFRTRKALFFNVVKQLFTEAELPTKERANE